MELHNFVGAKNAILQITWGKQNIEFHTEVVEKYWDGVIVTPFLYHDKPLELAIPPDGNVICNLFGDDPFNGKRVAFRNLELATEPINGVIYYYLKTSGYNKQSNVEDRRIKDRISLSAKGKMMDRSSDITYGVDLYDLSDSGISFFVQEDFEPKSDHLMIEFRDDINDREFDLRIECRIVRVEHRLGKKFYGCMIIKSNSDYLVYSCLKRLRNKPDIAKR